MTFPVTSLTIQQSYGEKHPGLRVSLPGREGAREDSNTTTLFLAATVKLEHGWLLVGAKVS